MPSTYNTPGVYRNEKDISEVVGGASTSIAATCSFSRKGLANQRILLTNNKEFIDIFGKPKNNDNYLGGYVAIEYLKESNQLYFSRMVAGDEKYSNIQIDDVSASTSGDDISAATSSVDISPISANYEDQPDSISAIDNAGTANSLLISMNGPGAYGNNYSVRIITQTVTGTANDGTTFSDTVDELSATYQNTINEDDNDISGNIFRIEVYEKETNEDWSTTGVGNIVESWDVAPERALANDGTQMFVEDVINGNSKYIYVKSGLSGDKPRSIINLEDGALTGGIDTTAASVSDAAGIWNGLYANKEEVPVNILIAPYKHSSTNQSLIQTVANLAATRADCIAVTQKDSSTDTTVSNVTGNILTFTGPSYVAVYSGWDKYYDTYNRLYTYLPRCLAGAIAMARTDRVANVWDAPAGPNRGAIGYSLGQNKVFNNTEIGQLYTKNINTAKRLPAGIYLWGQKTAQTKKSALDRINVRRLLLYIENSLEPAYQNFLFEINDDDTRGRIEDITNGFLETVDGGLTKYEVVCDETNNTPQVIDNNELVIDVYVQPAKVIEFIKLNIIITRTGVNFAELT